MAAASSVASPFERCVQFLASTDLGPSAHLGPLLAAARADPAFMREVGDSIGDEALDRAAAFADLSWPSLMIREGKVSSLEAAHPLMAAVMWFARPAPGLVLQGDPSRESLEMLFRAGRRSLEQMDVLGGANFVPGARRSAFEVLRTCQALHTVRGLNIPPHYSQHLAAALAANAPPSLTTLELEFFPSHQHAEWTAALPASLQTLVVRVAGGLFAAGMSDSIARCCPGLLTLSVSIGDLWDGPERERTTDIAFSTMLPALNRLRSLTLGDTEIGAPTVRAIARLPELQHLELSNVEGIDDADIGAALREFGAAATSLRTLTLVDSLYRGHTELIPLLDGMKHSATLCGLHIRHHSPAHFTGAGLIDVAAALKTCLAHNPITDLLLQFPHTLDAATVALVGAATAAHLTLRRLAMHALVNVDDHAGVWADLARCDRLESVVLLGALGFASRWSGEGAHDDRLSRMLRDFVAKVPCLECVDTGSLASPPTRIDEETFFQSYPKSRLAYGDIVARRRRLLTARAWAVVRTGIERQQERWFRQGAARRPASSSTAVALPSSVLRHVERFLDREAKTLRVG